MASLVDRGLALLNRAITPAAAVTVRYIRDSIVVSDALPAAPKASLVSIVTEGGTTIAGREFVIPVYRPDFVVDAIELKPKRGDVIEWYLNGKVHVFQVLPELGGTEQGTVDRRSDWIPVHVKLVEQRSE